MSVRIKIKLKNDTGSHLSDPGSQVSDTGSHANTTVSNLKEPKTWIERFRNFAQNSFFSQNWFWDNFNWESQSLWIGKFNHISNLSRNDADVITFIDKIINDLENYPDLKSQLYIKFYYTKNTRNCDPEINYLIISDSSTLPEKFKSTFAYLLFERFQLTPKIINMDPDFRKMLNHYLCWNNFYAYYELMNETNF